MQASYQTGISRFTIYSVYLLLWCLYIVFSLVLLYSSIFLFESQLSKNRLSATSMWISLTLSCDTTIYGGVYAVSFLMLNTKTRNKIFTVWTFCGRHHRN